jgi:hypothetical protein
MAVLEQQEETCLLEWEETGVGAWRNLEPGFEPQLYHLELGGLRKLLNCN